MALYAQEMLKHVLGDPEYTQDWNIYLYLDGYDPTIDIPTCEVSGSKTPLVIATYGYSGDIATADIATTIIGPLPASTIAGWYISNSTSDICAWTDAFDQPVVFANGEFLTIAEGDIQINLSL